MCSNVSKKNRNTTETLKKVFRIPEAQTRGGKVRAFVGKGKYIAVSLLFASVLAAAFNRNLNRLYEVGGDLPSAVEGVFSILIGIIFAVIGVYLVVYVLHPHFGRKPLPISIVKFIENSEAVENMDGDEILEAVNNLASKDEEVRLYLDSVAVKTDIAVTLGASLIAFFLGMYGYMLSYTIGYEGEPNILPVSICFAYIIFSVVYTILKTMKVVWDV